MGAPPPVGDDRRSPVGQDKRAALQAVVPLRGQGLTLATSGSPDRPDAHGAEPRAASSRAGARARLPVPPTPLIGREGDVLAAAALLDPAHSPGRLLTLVGPGGVGKTRLALAVAATLAQGYPDRVVFVDLAPLRDQRLVPATIAHTLEVRESGRRSARELLLDHLQDRQVLLVLDNFEHVLGAAPLLAELLEACPRLALLVTSRAALRLRWERRFPVVPLATPTADEPSLAAVAAAPAVQLFVQQAQSVAPDFVLDAANASAVAAICQRLDGIPLAIELAAARAGLLRPEALLQRLDHRLPLLTGGAADLPERQRTLRQTLAWSHDLLGPVEQLLFRRLAVFAGGWTVEAAEAVCADAMLPPPELFERLGVLADNSLVRRPEASVGTPRFSMLETVREFAEEQLVASGETATSRARHRDWCLVLVERVAPEWLDQEQVGRLDQEQDNLRAALRWGIQSRDTAAALRLGSGCWPLWYLRGRYAEGRAWLAEVLGLANQSDHAALHGRVLAYAGHLAYCEGDTVAAEALLQEGLAVAEGANDARGIGIGAHFLGNVARLRGDLVEAERQYTRALALARQTGGRAWETMEVVLIAMVRFERDDVAGARVRVTEALDLCADQDHLQARARALALSARLSALDGAHAQAVRQFEASLQLLTELSDQQGLAYAHLLAGHAALDRADRVDAAEHFANVLTIARETHDQPALTRGLEGVARLLATSQPRRALGLVAAAVALRQTLGVQLTPIDRVRLDSWVPGAGAAIGSAAEQGQVDRSANPVAAALADALEGCAAIGRAPAKSATAGWERAEASVGDDLLTRREREVALLLARGFSNRQVANELVITEGTARIHAERILSKLGLRSRVQVAAWAREHGLLSDQDP